MKTVSSREPLLDWKNLFPFLKSSATLPGAKGREAECCFVIREQWRVTAGDSVYIDTLSLSPFLSLSRRVEVYARWDIVLRVVWQRSKESSIYQRFGRRACIYVCALHVDRIAVSAYARARKSLFVEHPRVDHPSDALRSDSTPRSSSFSRWLIAHHYRDINGVS